MQFKLLSRLLKLLCAISFMAVLQNIVIAAEISTSTSPGDIGTSTLSRTYINLQKSQEKIRIFVVGDSIGTQLWRGLKRVFAKDPTLEIVNHSRTGTGFTSMAGVNWGREIMSLLAREKFDIVVVSFGVADRKDIRAGNDRHRFNSPKWRELYKARLNIFLKPLIKNKIAIYWAGPPTMREAASNLDMAHISQLYLNHMRGLRIKFTDTRNDFASAQGNFREWGPGNTKKMRKLRAADGIHFTVAGAEQLARLIAREIITDIEQARTHAKHITKAPLQTRMVTSSKKSPDSKTGRESPSDPAADPISPMKATKPPEIEAPKIIAQMPAPDPNEPAVIEPPKPAEPSLRERVLVKGEALEPKPGRADDFSWPRPD